jgi:hypothetical protein
MRDFSPIVLVLASSMGHQWEHFSVGCRITSQLVSDECKRWLSLVFQDPVKEAFGGFPVPLTCDQNIEDVTILIHCSPEIMPLAADRNKQFVHVPDVPESALSLPECAGICCSELLAPGSNRFVRHGHAAFCKQIFNIAKAKSEPMIQPDGMADDLGRKPVAAIQGSHRSDCRRPALT